MAVSGKDDAGRERGFSSGRGKPANDRRRGRSQGPKGSRGGRDGSRDDNRRDSRRGPSRQDSNRGGHKDDKDQRKGFAGSRRKDGGAGKGKGPRKDSRPRTDGRDKRRSDGFRKEGRKKYVEVNPYEVRGVQQDGIADASTATEEHPRKWEPNRERRKVKSKKAFDKERMDSLAEGTKTIYRGELDPREKDPNKKPRSISRSEQKVMEKAEALAEAEAGETRGYGKLATHTDFRDLFERCEASPGRLAALYATQQVRLRGAYAQEVIEASVDTAKISPEDRAFATLLTLGVVSSLGALDNVLNRALASPRDIQANVRDAMRISTYEIIYLRKAPHAALDQGVELVRAIAPSASGLANAVLHRVLAMADDFPFGDPSQDIGALALLYAFPKWLAKRLVADMGAQAAAAFMKASNEPAPLYISVNSLQATDREVIDLLKEVGTEVEPAEAGGIAPEGCYRVSNGRVLADGRVRKLFSEGKLLVSDAAAQAVAQCVIEDGMPASLLEVGAGRGTKTLLIQNLSHRMFGDQVELTTMDSHGFKTDLLRERAQTYGVRVNDFVTGNGARLDSVMGDRMFDEVFIDAPCSGLGTLRRHQDIRWRITEEQISELAEVGLSLLKSAAGHISEGGSIVYSTCTVTYDENNGVVKRFLESREGANFTLAPINGKSCFTTQLASGSPDAHFAAKFVRK